MWTVDLAKIEEDGLSIERALEGLDFIGRYPELEGFPSLHIRFSVMPLGERRFRLEGGLEGEARAVCGRCAEVFAYGLAREFHLTLEPESEAEQGKVEEVAPEAADLCYYSDDKLDVERLVEEQINLALPMKLLCRSECKGLCQRCGVNLNEATCGCPPVVDPRLAPLKKLIEG